jgi:hypothetical protein
MSNDDKPAADPGAARTLIIDLAKLLSLETDSHRQLGIRKLLVEEIDRIARQVSLENSAARVREARMRLERVKTLGSAHQNPEGRGALPDAMELSRSLFENFHRRLLKEFPHSIKLHAAVRAVCVSLRQDRRRVPRFVRGNHEVDATQSRIEPVNPKRPDA